MSNWRRAGIAPATAVLGVVLAACGSSTHSASPTVSSSAAATATSAPAGAPTLTVTPDTGLHNGETVRVSAHGFPAGQALVVTECADKGTATGPGDCDLQAIKQVTASASGTVSTTFPVYIGPFGANHIVCSASQRCLVSVSEPTASSPVEATADISFAG